MSKEIGSAHNNLFQNILGREDMARDFVRYYMPEEIVGDLDLDTLEVASESYVSDDLKESLSDIVLSLQLKDGDPAEIYILMEHKSGLHKGTRLQHMEIEPRRREEREGFFGFFPDRGKTDQEKATPWGALQTWNGGRDRTSSICPVSITSALFPKNLSQKTRSSLTEKLKT